MIDEKKLLEYAQKERAGLNRDNDGKDYGQYVALTNLITMIKHDIFKIPSTPSVPTDWLLAWIKNNTWEVYNWDRANDIVIDVDDLKTAIAEKSQE